MHAPSFAWTIHAAETTLRAMGEAKKKKHRDCPAKGGIITPEDCGRGRNSAIACPVDCPHNPFALENLAAHFHPLESKVIEQLSRKLIAELTPSQVRELEDPMAKGDEFTVHALLAWHFIGEGRLAKLKADGISRGWKNDEVVMLGHLETLRPALLEFREVRDAWTCSAVDLLQPGEVPLTVIDPVAAAGSCRYQVVLGWIYDLPNGKRLGGGAIILPPIPGKDPREAFQELIEHLGAPVEGQERWLMEHLPLLADAFSALGQLEAEMEHDRDLIPTGFAEAVSLHRFDAEEPAFEDFADRPLSVVEGKTPRQAAADPALRERLVTLMKGHIATCDHDRRTRGVDFDLNPLLHELGLDELILPPPPVGFVEEEEYDEEIPLDPPPSQDLLEGEELEARLDRVISDEALWNRLDIRLADVLDAFNDLSEKLNPNELQALQSTVLSALGALHPDQPPGYEPIPERMLARYESWMRSGDDQESIGDYLDRIFAESRQPALCESAADLLVFLEKESGKKLRPKKLDALFTAIAAAVWEAAHWPPVLD